MENSNDNANKTNANPTAAGTKVPLVKRVKVPVVRPVNPAVKPAGTATPAATATPAPAAAPAAQAQPAQTPAAPAAAPVVGVKEPPKLHRKPAAAKQQDDKDADKEKVKKPSVAVDMIRFVLTNKLTKLALFVALLAIACLGTYSSLPVIAEKTLPAMFAENGMPFRTFKIKSVTVDAMELSNVTDKSGSMSVSSIKFTYSLYSLYKSHLIRSMEMKGVTVTGEKTENGISLGAVGDLIYSPIQSKKGREITINSLKIDNGQFKLTTDEPREKFINEFDEEEEIDNTLYVDFSAKGSLSKIGLNMAVSTSHTSPKMSIKTETSLNKTAKSSQITTEITEGNLLKGEEKIGSVSGKLDVSVNDGVLSNGQADLVIASSSQKLLLKAEITPKDDKFDLKANLERSFENPQDAIGKFVGSMSILAENVTAKGTFKNFTASVPLKIEAPTITNGKLALRDLKTDMDLNLACVSSDCKVRLTKPMKFAFSGLQSTGTFRQTKLFNPLELTINPDPNDPFIRTDGGALNFTLPVSAFTTQALIADNVSSMQVAAAVNGLKTRLKYNPFSGAYSGDLTFQQSGFANKDIQLSGVQGIMSFTAGVLPDIRLRIAKATLVKPDVLPEMVADVRFRPLSRTEFGVDSTVGIQNGVVTATLNGAYTLPTHEWNLLVNIPKFILSQDALNIENTLPFLKSYLPETTSGGVAVKGRIAVKGEQVAGPVEVLLENVRTSWNGIGFESLNGVLSLSSVIPLATPENQQLYVGTLNTGVPFQNALFNFRVKPEQGVEIANLRMKYADGQFKTIKPFTVSPDGQVPQILLEGNGINLANLTGSLKSTALRLDGLMNSAWRLSITDKKLNLDGAKFISKSAGMLNFAPPAKMKGKMNPQMLAFLKDVVVKKMNVSAKGQMDGPVTFKVSIEGHSPLDTEGNNQNVSFDFSGGFKNFLRQENALIEIPSDILLSLQNFAKK